MIDYNKRLAEVDVILQYLSQEDYDKIPEEILELIEDNKDKDYIWEYDESKELMDQEVSRDAIAILAYINMQYLLNEEQKAYMQKVLDENDKKRLQEEYPNDVHNDYSDLFKRDKKTVETEEKPVEQTALIEYKESIFRRFINKIKSFFKR